MNAPDLHRSILKHHVATIEARYPLTIVGVLPAGSAPHVRDDDALALLAEKGPGLGYIALGQAEADLSDLLGRPVGIVLATELAKSKPDAAAEVRPL